MERIEDILFESGLLYVFAPDDRSADKSVVLAGVYDKSSREGVFVGHASFQIGHAAARYIPHGQSRDTGRV